MERNLDALDAQHLSLTTRTQTMNKNIDDYTVGQHKALLKEAKEFGEDLNDSTRGYLSLSISFTLDTVESSYRGDDNITLSTAYRFVRQSLMLAPRALTEEVALRA